MLIEILTVADCPNAAVAARHVHAALAALGEAGEVVERHVGDAGEAATAGMAGSPTILVDGVDPFATAGEEASLSCRLYRDGDAVTGAPTVAQLRAALEPPIEGMAAHQT